MPSDWQLRTNYGKGYGKPGNKHTLDGRPMKNPKPDWTDSCFIATAAYGTPMAEEINMLRNFRNQKLLPTTLGTQLVKVYYKISPPIADIIRRVAYFRRGIRILLSPLIKHFKK